MKKLMIAACSLALGACFILLPTMPAEAAGVCNPLPVEVGVNFPDPYGQMYKLVSGEPISYEVEARRLTNSHTGVDITLMVSWYNQNTYERAQDVLPLVRFVLDKTAPRKIQTRSVAPIPNKWTEVCIQAFAHPSDGCVDEATRGQYQVGFDGECLVFWPY